MDLLLPHLGSGEVSCSDSAPHAEDQPPCSGSMQAAGASPSQHGPIAQLELQLFFMLLLSRLHGCLLGSACTYLSVPQHEWSPTAPIVLLALPDH